MSEFEDNEIRDALRRRAGGATDGIGLEAAHAAVVARAARVRRRRAAAGGGAAMAALIAAAVFVIGPDTDSVVTNPAEQPTGSSLAPVDSFDGSTTTVPTNPDRTGPPQTDPDQPVIHTMPPANTSPIPVTTVPSTVTAPSTTEPSTTAPAAPGTTVVSPPTSLEPPPPTSGTAPTTTTAPSPAPFVQTHESGGGSITVRWDGTALSLQGVSPAPGFDWEVEDERADRIRVRFEGGDDEFRIEIRLEDGDIVRVE
ncbi:MAG TPA: hypothetical protein VFV63_11610 [Ilumatobacteraceae bacterium]|nr:hypothetical protein [Ilumatobacteraceae bacterium]